jgi:hypothetical protein
MKFTKEDAFESLKSTLTNNGRKTLRMSEKSLLSQLETLMPLLADEEMELDAFVEKVKPSFDVMNSNAEHDRSTFIKKWNAEHKTEGGEGEEGNRNNEDEATKALKEQLATLQRRLDDADRAKKETDTRKDFIAKVKEKGVKDSDWVKDYVSELTIGDDFDIEARVDTCVKLYNKGKAAAGKNATNPEGAGGDGDDSNKAITNTIAAAAELAKQRRP